METSSPPATHISARDGPWTDGVFPAVAPTLWSLNFSPFTGLAAHRSRRDPLVNLLAIWLKKIYPFFEALAASKRNNQTVSRHGERGYKYHKSGVQKYSKFCILFLTFQLSRNLVPLFGCKLAQLLSPPWLARFRTPGSSVRAESSRSAGCCRVRIPPMLESSFFWLSSAYGPVPG